jgi:NADPH-dependent 2,4-dienoyl-CoA reductase/sulfur reductase-like enzyme/rhodanese-related sulfurtransferase
MNRKRIVVIGGSAAGAKAAAKAARIDPHADITILQRDSEFSMAACGYPYYVGGVFNNRIQLISSPTGAVRNSKFFLNAKGIDAIAKTEALAIDPQARIVTCKSLETGDIFEKKYDKLIIATGARPVLPPNLDGSLEGVATFHSLRDADYLRGVRDEGRVQQAVIVGGGLIGLEACEAMGASGIELTVVERLPQILGALDWEMAKLLENYLGAHANVRTETEVSEFIGENGQLTAARLSSGELLPCQLAIVAIGVSPESKLASAAGVKVGESGGIVVDEYMRTSDPSIYAVGDCIEVKSVITGKPTAAPFGDLANLEGRVAGQNAILGDKVRFEGTTHTGICKVFDYAAGFTGLSEVKARESGFDNITSVIWAGSDKPHFMGGKLLVIKMVADSETGRVVGVQCLGPGDVSKRVAIAATAIQAKLTVGDLLNLDLPYAPPFSPAIDPIVATAHALENKMLGRMRGISSVETKRKVDAGESAFLLDTRESDEFARMRLGIGETLIPLGALRSKLDELPRDKEQEIICFCRISLRGYEAATVLQAHGWRNVKVLEGGIMAWPYAREK